MEPTQEILKMNHLSLLGPDLTDQQLKEGCAAAVENHYASVCVKPYQVRQAAEYLKGSEVALGAAISFPHGNATTAVKVAEAKQVLADGAVEVSMVVNLGKVLSEDWDYVRQEIKTLTDLAHLNGAILKVAYESDLLPEESFKVRLSEICSEVGVDVVKTTTDYQEAGQVSQSTE